MAYRQRTGIPAATQTISTDDPEFLRLIVERVLQALLDADAAQRAPAAHLHAEPYERSSERRGYRNGDKPRQSNTRVGTMISRVPQGENPYPLTEFEWMTSSLTRSGAK